MKPSTGVVLGLAAVGLAMVYGFYDSFAEEEEGIIALLASLINSTQADVEEVKMRMAELEAVNTELVRRISDLEHRLLNMTMPDAACGPGYYLNADTNTCEAVQPEGAPTCDPGYYLDAEGTCVIIRQGETPTCGPGYYLNADTNTCEAVQPEGAPTCDPGYYLDADTGTCVIIQDP